MNTKAYLHSRALSSGEYRVQIRYRFAGENFALNTEWSVKASHWDKENGRFKSNAPDYKMNNRKLDALVLSVKARLERGENPANLPKDAKPLEVDLVACFLRHIQAAEIGAKDIAGSTIKNYKVTLGKLEKYQATKQMPLYFDQITQDFYTSFLAHLKQSEKFGMQGFYNHIRRVKTIMKLAEIEKLHSNNEYRHFKVKRSAPDKVYLNEGEIEQLHTFDLSAWPKLEKERDRFLLSYYTLTRYSDSVQLKRSHLLEEKGVKYLRFKIQKTKRLVRIPLKPEAEKILEKHQWDMEGSNQKSNALLKEVCRLVGITTKVWEDETEGPKCDFVTTHTARRSAAINLSSQGMPENEIMDLGGWESREVLRTYLKNARFETATRAANHPFFQ